MYNQITDQEARDMRRHIASEVSTYLDEGILPLFTKYHMRALYDALTNHLVGYNPDLWQGYCLKSYNTELNAAKLGINNVAAPTAVKQVLQGRSPRAGEKDYKSVLVVVNGEQKQYKDIAASSLYYKDKDQAKAHLEHLISQQPVAIEGIVRMTYELDGQIITPRLLAENAAYHNNNFSFKQQRLFYDMKLDTISFLQVRPPTLLKTIS